MTCTRCQGCIAKAHFIDLMETADCPWLEDWHYCLNCGSAHDPVIEQPRLVRQEKVLVTSSGELDYQDDEVPLGEAPFIRLVA